EDEAVAFGPVFDDAAEAREGAGADLYFYAALEEGVVGEARVFREGEPDVAELFVEAFLVFDGDDLRESAGAVGGVGVVGAAAQENVAGEDGNVGLDLSPSVGADAVHEGKVVRDAAGGELAGDEFFLPAARAKKEPRTVGVIGEGVGQFVDARARAAVAARVA